MLSRIMRRPEARLAPIMATALAHALAGPPLRHPHANTAVKTLPPTPKPATTATAQPKAGRLRGRPDLSAYLQKILNARVYDVAVETALDGAQPVAPPGQPCVAQA